jgi:hypothetical protein
MAVTLPKWPFTPLSSTFFLLCDPRINADGIQGTICKACVHNGWENKSCTELHMALHNAQKPHAALCSFAQPVYYILALKAKTEIGVISLRSRTCNPNPFNPSPSLLHCHDLWLHPLSCWLDCARLLTFSLGQMQMPYSAVYFKHKLPVFLPWAQHTW